MASTFVVGIDLGTTNSAVASVDLSESKRRIDALGIEQLVAAGEVGPRPLLPSALYLPAGSELAAGALKLPWGEPEFATGTFAREQGARVPGRLVTSAKSWLCHPGVDRSAAILPWGAADDVKRVSPVEASASYLSHMRDAWQHRHARKLLAEQDVVLTVPASFDEVARELTVEAARIAGLPHVTLLEEPLAAFYHWLEGHQTELGTALAGVSMVLVIDVGGGTTDLTLIEAKHPDAGMSLDRVAVGDHLLLGGDNIDLGLARIAEKRLTGSPLDASEWNALVLACRSAKEALLAADAPATRSITVLGRSSRLMGGVRKVEVTRDEVRALVLDGFFSKVASDAKPDRRAALQELGLPYAGDAAITKHIAAFLTRHLTDGQIVDAVLFNGGALTPALVQNRLIDVLESWSGKRPKLLANDALDLAVARGAAYYGLVRRGEGVRVGGGSPRAYFLGVQTGRGAEAVCVIPHGLAEGSSVSLPDRELVLTTGRPVRFELFSSTLRKTAKPGDLIAMDDSEDLVRLPPIQTVVRAAGAGDRKVRLVAGITEIGTLALFFVAGDDRFKLEFQLRGDPSDSSVSETAALPRRFDEACELVRKFYGKKPAADVDAREVKGLLRSLEKVIGPREAWTLPMLRELWGVLWGDAQRRRRSADHERMWIMLAGYSLGPGFGASLDDWRVKETFSVFAQGLQFHQEKPAWDQWWILWRRISGGLEESSQLQIVEAVRPYLEPVPAGKSRQRPKGPKFEGHEEMIRMVASLERLSPAVKVEVANWLWARLEADSPSGNGCWSIGRIGARAPFHGSAHQVVRPEIAEEWLTRLLAMDWTNVPSAVFAATVIARATGDRARDVGEAMRTSIVARLEKAKAFPAWIQMVREPLALAAEDEQRLFGDSLPVGLKLVE